MEFLQLRPDQILTVVPFAGELPPANRGIAGLLAAAETGSLLPTLPDRRERSQESPPESCEGKGGDEAKVLELLRLLSAAADWAARGPTGDLFTELF